MHAWISEHIEWVLSLIIAAFLTIAEFVRRHFGRVAVLEEAFEKVSSRLDTVEEDLTDAASARKEGMILMRTIQEEQKSISIMLARIDERTAKDYSE